MTYTDDAGPESFRIRFFNTFEPVTTYYRDLVPALVVRGMSVDILLSRAEYREGRGRLEDRIGRKGVRVLRIPTGGVRWGRGIRRVWIILTYMIGAATRSLLGRGVDLNVFLTQPPLFTLWGRVLKAIRGQPYLVVVMDYYPDLAIRAGLIREDSWIAYGWRVLMRASMFGARKVIVIGRCMRERMIAAGIPAEKIRVIPNWTDQQQVFPMRRYGNSYRVELGIEDRFVVLYGGNLGVSHAFDELLKAARNVCDHDGIAFVLAGAGSQKQGLADALNREGLQNVWILSPQPYERLGELMALGDTHYVSLRPGFQGLVVPSKAYSALAAGRPLLYQGPPDSEIAMMIEEHGVGRVVPPGAAGTLESAIRCWAEAPDAVQDMGERARELALGMYAKECRLEEYSELFLGLADRR